MSLMYRASDTSTYGDFCTCLMEGLPSDAYNLRGHCGLPMTLEIALTRGIVCDVNGKGIQGIHGGSWGEEPVPATAIGE